MLLSEEDTKEYFIKMQKTSNSYQKVKIFKQIHEICKKTRTCLYCNEINGTVKKLPKFPLKIIHDKYGYILLHSIELQRKTLITTWMTSLKNLKDY
jgi:hypothetical protein